MSDFKVGCGNSKGFSRAGKRLRDWLVKVPRLGWTVGGQACTLRVDAAGKARPEERGEAPNKKIINWTLSENKS